MEPQLFNNPDGMVNVAGLEENEEQQRLLGDRITLEEQMIRVYPRGLCRTQDPRILVCVDGRPIPASTRV